MQSMRNRRSPRVPNEPWRGPFALTIWQVVALFGAFLLAAAIWWLTGFVPGATTFGLLATRGIVTGLCGGIGAVLLYAAADDRREPFVRQHLTYLLRHHAYVKEPSRDTEPLPFRPRRPLAPRLLGRPAPRGRRLARRIARAVRRHVR
jgi:hypothetical protein